MDIDIALDNMSGLEFAELVQGSLARSQSAEKVATEATVAVIHRNPDKSKHLETARVKVGATHLSQIKIP